jgi:hypothetical protein
MYLGLFLAGCFILSIVCFASALTKSQVVAGMLTLVAGMVLLMLNWLAQNVSPLGHWQAQVLTFFNLSQQMMDFTRGVLDTRVIIFYLSVTFFFLFLTLRVIESRRWKYHGHSLFTSAHLFAATQMGHRFQRGARHRGCVPDFGRRQLSQQPILFQTVLSEHRHAGAAFAADNQCAQGADQSRGCDDLL